MTITSNQRESLSRYVIQGEGDVVHVFVQQRDKIVPTIKWKSEDRLWLVELCAPFATEENKLNEAMVADLMPKVFVGKSFKMYVTDPLTGKRQVKEMGG